MKAAIFPGWWQVAVGMMIQAVSTAAVFTGYSVVAMPLQRAFEPSRAVLMLGITVTALVSGLLNPLLGTALDRYSLRAFMLAGAGCLASAYLALSFAPSMTYVIVVYGVFMSVGSVLLGPLASSALLARWFSRRRGLAMGIAGGGSTVGGLIFPPLLQGLIDHLDWRIAFRVFGGIILLVAVPVIALLVVNRPSDRNLYPDGDSRPAHAADDRRNGKFETTGAVLRDANFWLIALIIGSTFSGSAAIAANVLPIVIGKGISADWGTLLIPVLSAGAFTGKMLFAPIADRVDLRVAFATAMLAFGLGVFGFLKAENYPPLVAASALVGIGGGAAVPLWSLLVARGFGPENIGRVMGLMAFVVMPLTLGAPPLFGWIFDKTGSYNDAYILDMAVLAFAALLLPRVRIEPATPIAAPAGEPG